jgi:hypothetical protein
MDDMLLLGSALASVGFALVVAATVDAHLLRAEVAPSVDDAVDIATIPPLAGPRRSSFDVTSTVASRFDGDENDGMAWRLCDAGEVRRASRPGLASTRAEAAAGSRLAVTHEGGGASG